jgi:hypothetical protein
MLGRVVDGFRVGDKDMEFFGWGLTRLLAALGGAQVRNLNFLFLALSGLRSLNSLNHNGRKDSRRPKSSVCGFGSRYK